MISYNRTYDYSYNADDPSRSVVMSDPTYEPLDLDEAKTHLGISLSDSSRDDHISKLIIAARQVWERDTQTITTQRTITESLNKWPDETWRFYYRPVVSITSINYYDVDNVTRTLSAQDYTLDAPNRHLLLESETTSWPSIFDRWDAIAIAYVAGKSKVDEIVKHAMKLQVDIMFELRGLGKERDKYMQAYECFVRQYGRSSYP